MMSTRVLIPNSESRGYVGLAFRSCFEKAYDSDERHENHGLQFFTYNRNVILLKIATVISKAVPLGAS